VFCFGVLGYLMMKCDIPTVPMLIGFILIPIFEENLRITILLGSSHDLNIGFIFTRPAFLTLLLIMMVASFIVVKRRKLQNLEKINHK
jgi:putative tricarboxylic transport membrane protein